MNPKFKVGDKVQVVECIDGGYHQVGTIFTVKEVYQDNRDLLEDYEKIIYFFEEDDCGCYEAELDYYSGGN